MTHVLGKSVTYADTYKPSLLEAIPRHWQRDAIGITLPLAFVGWDLWNAYEISWLNTKGKPQVALAQIKVPCTSPNLIESKSFKLYLNSFNNTRFESTEKVRRIIAQDLSSVLLANVKVTFFKIDDFNHSRLDKLSGTCLDDLDITVDDFLITPASDLKTHGSKVTESLYSHLLKSNCLVTGQPDWASVQINYTGKQIDHAGLLRYLVSFRNHMEFHEQCVERIYTDVMKYCKPEGLCVMAYYTRRGGIDINPFRASDVSLIHPAKRLCRQ